MSQFLMKGMLDCLFMVACVVVSILGTLAVGM